MCEAQSYFFSALEQNIRNSTNIPINCLHLNNGHILLDKRFYFELIRAWLFPLLSTTCDCHLFHSSVQRTTSIELLSEDGSLAIQSISIFVALLFSRRLCCCCCAVIVVFVLCYDFALFVVCFSNLLFCQSVCFDFPALFAFRTVWKICYMHSYWKRMALFV